MANGKQADIDANVLHLVKEEDNPCQKQQMVISSHHVFRPQIHKGDKVDARDFLNVALVAFSDGMGKGGLCKQRHENHC
jgi:hypothetical protein